MRTIPSPPAEAAPPHPAWRRTPASFAGLAILAGVVALARSLDPTVLRHVPACPLHQLTGLYCPGCGTTRALYHLLRGELLAACSANALAVFSLGAVLLAWLARVGLAPRRRRLGARARRIAILAAALLVLAFGVLRNLQAAPFAWLAP